jgi:hypothetical protein
VSDLGYGTIPDCPAKLEVQFLNVSELLSETPNFVFNEPINDPYL